MKKYIITIVIACSILFMQSCKKDHETKYVTLNETVKSGKTYVLDLSIYGSQDAVAAIATQPVDFTISKIDHDVATGRNIYHFATDSKTQAQEKTIINITDKKNNRCSHDDDKTVLTINFSIQ